jgi:hypothetical protein
MQKNCNLKSQTDVSLDGSPLARYESAPRKALLGMVSQLKAKARDDNKKYDELVNTALEHMQPCVIVSKDLGEGDKDFFVRLELRKGDIKMPVLEWRQNGQSTTVTLHHISGKFRKIPGSPAPKRAERELIEIGVRANAKQYCKQFLAGELAA